MKDYVLQIKFKALDSEKVENVIESFRESCEEQVTDGDWSEVAFAVTWRDKIEQPQEELDNGEEDDFATL